VIAGSGDKLPVCIVDPFTTGVDVAPKPFPNRTTVSPG